MSLPKSKAGSNSKKGFKIFVKEDNIYGFKNIDFKNINLDEINKILAIDKKVLIKLE